MSRSPLFTTLCAVALLTSALSACSESVRPPSDPIKPVLSAMERGAWGELSELFEEGSLERFPLKRAMDTGARWEGVKRARLMDNHMVVDVDLTSPNTNTLTRYTFWLTLPRSLTQLNHLAPFDDEGAETDEADEAVRVEAVAGWREPHPASAALIELDDMNTPTRFSATSFRGVPDVATLAVFDEESLDLKGWSANLSELKADLKPHKKRGCKRVNVRVSRPVLESEMKRCAPLLAQEAQRAELSGARAIHNEVALYDKQRASFAGRFTLRLDLSVPPRLRAHPDVLEAMVLSRAFSQCVKERVTQWSREYLPQAACDLTLPMLFKVSMPSKRATP